MQQKTILRLRSGLMVSKAEPSKFIIYLTLICFVSLLFLPGKVWGVNPQPAGGGGDPCKKECIRTEPVCVASTAYCTSSPNNPQCCEYKCVEWKPLPPECTATTTTCAGDGQEKEQKWCCDCNGVMNTCYRCTKTGAYTDQAQCEACCPCGVHKICRPSLLTGKGLYCKSATWCEVNPGNECKVDADCQVPAPTPVPTTPKYSCNTSTWTCSQDSNGVYSSESTCKENCIKLSGVLTCPGDSNCYKCNTSYQCVKSSTGSYTSQSKCLNACIKPTTTPTSPPPTSPPPTLPETEPCMISYFELPARAWVNYSITGRWSASDWCDDCDIDCTPYPECVWKQNNIGIWDEYKFKLSQSGTYTYTLTCYGQTSEDKRQEIRTIQAINLPWWREIIPVLPGFLRGIFR